MQSQGFKSSFVIEHRGKGRQKAQEGLVPIEAQSISTT